VKRHQKDASECRSQKEREKETDLKVMRCGFRKISKFILCSAILICMFIVFLQDFDRSNIVSEEKTSFGQGQNGRRGLQRPVDLLDNEVSILHRNAKAIAPDAEKYTNTHTETYKKRKHRQTELNDIYIAIKTTRKYHGDRLQLLLDTWVALARDQVTFTSVLN